VIPSICPPGCHVCATLLSCRTVQFIDLRSFQRRHDVSSSSLCVTLVQNSIARVVCRTSDRSVSASSLLHQLHWLPVEQRIRFKLASLCYRVVHTGQPKYLASMLTPYEPPRQLRSSSTGLLVVPPHRIDIASRRFSCAAPRIWNTLPLAVRSAPSLRSFKTALKTYLYDAVH